MRLVLYSVLCGILLYYYCVFVFFFFKQKTAYEMRISDWSSDVCSSDLQDVAAISDALTQHRRLQARHDSGFGIIVEREDRDGGLADRKGGCGDDRRDQSLKPLAGLGQLRRNTRVARMNVDADMVGDQTDDALAVRRRQSFARVGQAFTEPIDPKASVGVEHDFDDGGIGEPGGDRRAERCAQHPRAARNRKSVV